MMRVLSGLSFALWFVPSLALAQVQDATPATQAVPQKAVPISVESFEADAQDDTTLISVKLSQKPIVGGVELEDHGTFMQVTLNDAVIAKPGEFFDAKTPYVSKIVGFQTHPETVSMRFFVSKEASIVRKASKVEILDSQIVLSIDHKKVEELLKVDPTLTAQSKNMPTAEEVIQKTAVDKEIPEPASVLKAVEEEAPKVTEAVAAPIAFKDSEGLNKRLVNAAMFCAIMLLGLVGVYVFKPRLKRLRAIPDNYPEFVMRTIATHKVSPKQRIELLDVGGEKILIAIGPDQVNFLTTVGAEPTRQPAQRLAQAALPNNPLTAINRAQAQQQALPRQAAVATPTKRRIVIPPKPEARPVVEPAKAFAATKRAESTPTTRIATRVGDEIKIDYSKKSDKDSQTINDVTRMIREKLKNLPSI